MDEEILEYLNGNSGLQYRELIDLFMQKFPNETDAIYEHIRETLDDMHKNGLIKLKNASTYNALGKMVTIPGNMQGGKELYSLGVINGREGANIEAKITIDGRKVLAELKFKRKFAFPWNGSAASLKRLHQAVTSKRLRPIKTQLASVAKRS